MIAKLVEDWERRTIVDHYMDYSDDGYRRVTYMMMDYDEASTCTTYEVLSQGGVLRRRGRKKSLKRKGIFVQPLQPAHWYADAPYLNILRAFHYLGSTFDGYSRYSAHHEICGQMGSQVDGRTEFEIIAQRALEDFSGYQPSIISDNGPQSSIVAGGRMMLALNKKSENSRPR